MGEVIPPNPPSGDCDDCCAELPESLFMMVAMDVNGTEVYTGTITRAEENPCIFRGTLTHSTEPDIAGGIIFCWNGNGEAEIGCSLHPTCLAREAYIADLHCFPIAWGVSDDGVITYHVT